MAENHLRSALSEGRFTCSAELVLGRDHSVPDTEAFVRDAANEPDGVKVISLTDLPSGGPALPPEAFVPFVIEHGLTPIPHLTGKDGNRSFIEARLHGLAHMGVENLLALTGDIQHRGFQGRAKGVYDLDSVLILWLAQALREGIEYQVGPRSVQSTPFDFFPGAVVSPYKCNEPDQMMQLLKMELKIVVGARFIITQLGYNLRKLYELKQFMEREGLGHVPVLANIYVPTATIATMMRSGDISGCVVSEELIARLKGEKKPQRLERAALMVAAVRDLGFSGAHIGGFGLKHGDFMRILERSEEIGGGWRDQIDELVWREPDEFYLLPEGSDGLSDPEGPYNTSEMRQSPSLTERLGRVAHDHIISGDSAMGRFLHERLNSESDGASGHKGLWHRALGPSTAYRKAALGCMSCGDCIQDHLHYAGCTMSKCYKELRNGPCGGSRIDGTCEADRELPCIWNTVYEATLAAQADPRKFATTLVPPRDWCLDQTNAMANRILGLDNACRREDRTAGDEGPEA
jgi:methylenetetrahydrofolate reductase (NADPH)